MNSINKISNCKELNPFDHYNILDKIENKQINKMLSKINNHTCKLISIVDHNYFYIIHKSTKKHNKIQASLFKNCLNDITAISDIERNNYYEIINEIGYINYKLQEVI